MVVKPMEFFMVRICMKVLFALSSCRVCGLFVSCEEPILRPSGGIGRRSGLKIPCPLGRAGSSPASAISLTHAMHIADLRSTLSFYSLSCRHYFS